MLYSSINNEKIKFLKKLNNKKYRDEFDMFLVEGEHLVLEAYKAGCLSELYLLENISLSLDVSTNYISHNVLKYISSLDCPNGIIGVCRKMQSSLKEGKIVILDGVQDPGNLGTIIRSCVAFNVDTLVLNKECVDLYNSKVIRASQGMLFNLNIMIVDDLFSFIKELKGCKYQIFSTNVINGNDLKSIEISDRFAIIMGNEGNGVSKLIDDICDERIFINMNPLCESLNVGVATSIILYEFDR